MKRSKKSLLVPNGRFKIGIPLFIVLDGGEKTTMNLSGNDEVTSIAYIREGECKSKHDFFIQDTYPK